jgi:Zn-dependent M28 family amino/carboxypeptidase
MSNSKLLTGAIVVAAIASIGIFSDKISQSNAQMPAGALPVMHQLVSETSADTIETYITKLVNFGTRHTLSDTKSDTRGIGAARRWIEAEFNKISADCGGCLEVITVSDFVEGTRRIKERTEIVNVIAIQRGTLDPNRIVMMSGDIDNRVSDSLDGTSDNPGANDNASGMAGVIEAARVMSKHKFAGTVVYAGLSGEEQGLFGGQILADYALANNWRIQAVLNNDMIGNIEGVNGVINNSTARVFSEGTRDTETPQEGRIRRFTGGEVDSPSRNIGRYVDLMADKYIPNLDVMMVYRLDRFGRGGHHRPFNEKGIPGVRIMETNENYNRQHQDLRTENGIAYGDVLSGVNFDYARKLTALNIVSMAGMASAPPMPSNVGIKGAVRPSTSLNWTVPEGKAAENLAGYKVYWRLTTDAQWNKNRYVGLVDNFTLENVVIDNYFFGVSAVSSDGYETPVVFPGPNGSFGPWVDTAKK